MSLSIEDQITQIQREIWKLKDRLKVLKLKQAGGEKYEAWKEKQRTSSKQRYENDLETERKYAREQKSKQRDARREELNAVVRAWYDRNRDVEAGKQNTRRQTREPHRIVRASLKLLSKGDIGVDECLERVSAAIALSDKIIAEIAGK